MLYRRRKRPEAMHMLASSSLVPNITDTLYCSLVVVQWWKRLAVTNESCAKMHGQCLIDVHALWRRPKKQIAAWCQWVQCRKLWKTYLFWYQRVIGVHVRRTFVMYPKCTSIQTDEKLVVQKNSTSLLFSLPQGRPDFCILCCVLYWSSAVLVAFCLFLVSYVVWVAWSSGLVVFTG